MWSIILGVCLIVFLLSLFVLTDKRGVKKRKVRASEILPNHTQSVPTSNSRCPEGTEP